MLNCVACDLQVLEVLKLQGCFNRPQWQLVSEQQQLSSISTNKCTDTCLAVSAGISTSSKAFLIHDSILRAMHSNLLGMPYCLSCLSLH